MDQRLPQSAESAHTERVLSSQREAWWWRSLPDALVVWDRAGTILSLNAAACTLFEISASDTVVGTSIQSFLQRYTWSDERHQSFFFAPWLLDPMSHQDEAEPRFSEQALVLGLPSTRTVLLDLRCIPFLDAQGQPGGMLAIFQEVAPRYQKALHLQRVYEAVMAFHEAIAQLPEQFPATFSEDNLLLSPPVLFVDQQLVTVIHTVLACWRVNLLAFSSSTRQVTYAVGSGFTAEQEHQRRELAGRFSASDFVDDTVLARLQANQEVIFTNERFLRSLKKRLADTEAATLLIIPLLLEQQLVGGMVIRKQGWDRGYSREEIDLARAVAAQALLLMECLGALHKHVGEQARALILSEVSRLSNEFLRLASHELRTPLTGIKGHLQVAQRRLGRLKRMLFHQSAPLGDQLTRAQHSLASAEQSVRLQERMVQDLIDDARIQARQLELSLRPCNMLTVIQTAVAKQQASRPERVITLDNLTSTSTIPVLADAGRVDQVLSIYLANALAASPAERPVTVQIQAEGTRVRVSVHDEGPGIPLDEQNRLWGRFYRGKGSAIQHELDLSLGLSFYLCQELIERHQGSVGVESEPGHGATFWFTLPMEMPAGT